MSNDRAEFFIIHAKRAREKAAQVHDDGDRLTLMMVADDWEQQANHLKNGAVARSLRAVGESRALLKRTTPNY